MFSAEECYQANDSQIRDFFDTSYKMSISYQNTMFKVNYFL